MIPCQWGTPLVVIGWDVQLQCSIDTATAVDLSYCRTAYPNALFDLSASPPGRRGQRLAAQLTKGRAHCYRV